MNRYAIEVDGLGKLYPLGPGQRVRIHDVIGRAVRTALRLPVAGRTELFWAVKDCTFAIRGGEVVGILGHNGAGKSVLLKMLSRVLKPTIGSAVLRGRVVSLLELGAGFDPEMTGRENVYLNSAILGIRRAQVHLRIEEIIAFSGIERFIDEPAKNYSSGMYARLAFAIAAHVDADVLLIDEALAVGDYSFRQKCLTRLKEAAGRGTTILFVSHSVEQVRLLCTRCLVLDHGKKIFDGDPEHALRVYCGDAMPEEGAMFAALGDI